MAQNNHFDVLAASSLAASLMTRVDAGIIPEKFRGRKVEVQHLAPHHDGRKCVVHIDDYTDDLLVDMSEGVFPQSAGSSYNVVHGLKKLGMNPGIMGTLGNDFFSEQLEDSLRDEGIPLLAIPRGKGTPITLSCVEESGVTTLFNFKPPYVLSMRDAIEQLRGKTFDFVLATGVRSSEVELMIRLFTAQNDNMLIPNQSVCCQADETSIATMLRLTNIIQVNFDEAQVLSNCVDGDLDKMAHKILALGPKKVIITLAEDGAYLGRLSVSRGNLKRHQQKAFKADPVDNDGAGDAFAVGFVFALRQGHPTAKALEVGAFVAARNIEGFGGYGGMPTYEQVAEVLQ
jgi:sugar/nucleoside kinase (ribokinase family)